MDAPASYKNQTSLTRFSLSGTGVALAAAGPLLTVLAVGLAGWDQAMAHAGRIVAVLAWSPLLPFGVPALMLQDLRDQVAQLGPRHSVTRCAGYLFTWGPARVLAFSWANLAGVAVAAAVALT